MSKTPRSTRPIVGLVRHPRRAAARVRGFSLIEVLVVILIMTFGLLGIAGLQAATAKYKVNSWVRSAASVQFSDLADRLRANPAQAGGRYLAATGAPSATSAYLLTDDWDTQQAVTDFTPARNCLTTTCTAAQRAEFDLTTWRGEVRRQFPQGAVTLTGDVAIGVTATVAWFDRQFTNAAGELQSSEVCTAASAGAVAANCCPDTLDAPAGVRCANMIINP